MSNTFKYHWMAKIVAPSRVVRRDTLVRIQGEDLVLAGDGLFGGTQGLDLGRVVDCTTRQSGFGSILGYADVVLTLAPEHDFGDGETVIVECVRDAMALRNSIALGRDRVVSNRRLPWLLRLLEQFDPIDLATVIDRSGVRSQVHGAERFSPPDAHTSDKRTSDADAAALAHTAIGWFSQRTAHSTVLDMFAVGLAMAECVPDLATCHPRGNLPREFTSGADFLAFCRAVSVEPETWTHTGSYPSSLANELRHWGADRDRVERVRMSLHALLMTNLLFRNLLQRVPEVRSGESDAARKYLWDEAEALRASAHVELTLLACCCLRALGATPVPGITGPSAAQDILAKSLLWK
jgi:hypothetical protein